MILISTQCSHGYWPTTHLHRLTSLTPACIVTLPRYVNLWPLTSDPWPLTSLQPIGALNESRLQSFVERYHGFSDEGIPPFHYGTHYSTMAFVLHWLVRIEPYTTLHIGFHDGLFDHAARLFTNVAEAWTNANRDSANVNVSILIVTMVMLTVSMVILTVAMVMYSCRSWFQSFFIYQKCFLTRTRYVRSNVNAANALLCCCIVWVWSCGGVWWGECD